MLIDLYGNGASAPCRSVLLTAKTLGVAINMIQTKPMSPDVEKPDFIKVGTYVVNFHYAEHLYKLFFNDDNFLEYR